MDVLIDMPTPLHERVVNTAYVLKAFGSMDPGGNRHGPTLRSLAWEEIQAQAEAAYADTDPQEAVMKFIETDDGKRLLEWYHLPDASRPIMDWLEDHREQLRKRQVRKMRHGVETAAEQLDSIAKRKVESDAVSYIEALRLAALEDPDLYQEARRGA